MKSFVYPFSKSFAISIFAFCMALTMANSAQAQQNNQLGDAIILSVGGSGAIVIKADGSEVTPLKGMKLLQGDTIQTSTASTVSLALSNGGSITLRPSTTMRLETLLQVPFTATPLTGKYGTIVDEPTRSKTRLRLDQGEILGEVHGLNSESVFEVATDLGTAGIRGTIFQVKIEKVGSVWRMSILNADGTVDASSDLLNVDLTNVEKEEIVVIEAEYNDETGDLTLKNVDKSTLPPETVQSLTTEAGDLAEQAKEAENLQQQQPPPPPPPSTGNDDDGRDDSNDDSSGEDPIISPS